jgi:hypothetical protein
MQETVNAASRLARSVAGDDDAAFMRTFQAVLNTAQTEMGEGGRQPAGRRRAAAPGRRAAAAPPQDARAAGEIPRDSVYSDPVFLANARALLSNRRRIVGGVPDTAFADCVAVGSPTQWCCTGTLIAPNVVVTAGHCDQGGCGNRIFVGTDVDDPRHGRIVKVRVRHTNPGYRPPRDQDDIAVLVLDREVTDVEPRAIATPAALRSARSVRVVGYGYTDTSGSTGYGIRRLVDVPLASADKRFGCDPKTEFVAGAPFLDKDSCNGDSGGPAYVYQRGAWLLAGATSRATASAIRPCGDGGIYTTVNAYRDWLAPFVGSTGTTAKKPPRGGRRH